MQNEKILVAVPAFNEEKAIAQVIADIKTALPSADILVINDASLDDTSARAKAAAVKVIDLPVNLGIGGAVQTGFRYARRMGYHYMLQIDGDGQHVPKEAAKLYQAMLDTQSDMVIGSRFLEIKSYRTTYLRRLGIKLFYVLFRVLINARITDSTSGFRIYNQKSIELLAKHYSDDYPEPDAIIFLRKNGLKVAEVGVEMRAREHGSSSITSLKSPYYMAKVLLSILFSYSRARV